MISKTMSEDESLVYAHDNGIEKALGIYRCSMSWIVADKDKKTPYVPGSPIGPAISHDPYISGKDGIPKLEYMRRKKGSTVS